MPGKFAIDAERVGAVELEPPAEGIRLWWRALTVSPSALPAFAALLSEAERARAARFGRSDLRDRYVVGRGTLRSLLGDELGVDPAEVAIVRGERGRPRLAAAGSGIDFNVSHTAGFALIALTRAQRIGVDIERQDRVINAAGVARKFLGEHEREALPAEGDAFRERVLRLWTCKEAMSKATGDALSAPFSRLEVQLEPTLALIEGTRPYVPADWRLYPAAVPAGFLGTVAVWDRGVFAAQNLPQR